MSPATHSTETFSPPVPKLPTGLAAGLAGLSTAKAHAWTGIGGASRQGGVPPETRVHTGGLAPWQVKRFEAHLAERLDTPLRLADVAGLVGVSTSHFSRAFKKTFGRPFSQYVTAARLERARTLLRSTRQSISDIALTCGMADQSHLTRLFHRRFGAPPHAWRRAHGWPRSADQAPG